MSTEKRALITGVSGGLGGKIAESLLKDSWAVWGASRRKPALSHERFTWFRTDMGDANNIQDLLNRLPKGLDALILAAGISGPVGPGLSLPLTGWRETFEVNFFAPLAISQALLNHGNSNASVIFFSGGGAATPRPLVGPYAVSKLAAVKLAEQLAIEHPDFRFYAIAPGAHDTEIYREQRVATGEPAAKFAEFSDVDRLVKILIADRDRRLNGRFVHVRDDIEKLLSHPEGGTIRRVEVR